MSRIPKILSTLVVLCMLTTLQADEKTSADATESSSQPRSIIQRRSALPTGWFQPGDSRSVVIPTASEVRPAAHFDATGESDDTSRRVKSRLRRVRDAVVYENLQQPKEATSAASDAPGNAPSARRPANTPPSENSSSRRRSPRSPSSTVTTPLATTSQPAAPATTNQSPSATNPADSSPAATSQTDAGQANGTQPAQTNSAAAASPLQPAPTTTEATPENITADSAAAGQAVGPVVSVAAKPARSTNSESANSDLPLAPPSDAAPAPERTNRADAVSSSPSDVVFPSEQAEPALANPQPTQNGLPSVMKPTVLRSTEEPMTLTPIDGNARSRSSENLGVTPMVELATRPTRESDEDDRILIRNESPVLSVVTRGPKTLVVGKSATYVLDLKNAGDVGARDVIVRVNIPESAEVVRQHPSVGTAHIHPDDTGRSVLSWRVAQLSGHGGEKLHLELIPRTSRPLDLGVTWNFTPAKSSAQIQVKEPKLQLNVIGPQDVLYGETKVFSITISNPGTGDAENVVLNLLPLVPGERQAAVRNLGTVPAGTRQTMEVELTARQTGRLQVRAEATADGGLHAKSKQDVLVRRGSLAVSVEGPPMKYAGTRARYAVRVRNTGDAPASQVSVVANVPGGATNVASSDGGTLDPNSGQVEWHVGVLRPGASRVFEMECKLMSAGDNRIDVRSAAAGDLSALGSAVTKVESLADLKLTVNDPQGAIAVGADVAYEVRIVNRGTKAAQNVQLFGYFSNGIEPVRVGGWRGEINEGEVVLQAIPRLGPGQEMVLKITAQASRAGDHVFRAELECNDPETKLAVEEWTRFYGDDRPTQAAQRRSGPAPAKRLKLQRF